MSSRPRGIVPPPRQPRTNRRFERPGGYRPARPNANPARRVFRRRLARPAFRPRVQGFQHFLSLGITLGIGVILGLALLIFESVYASRVNPNISVDGIPLGGVSLADAPAYLRHKETDRDLQPSVVRVGTDSFTITNHQFRARYTLDAAVRQAMREGHGGDPLGRLWEQVRIMVQGRDYSISGTHDRRAVARYLADLDRKISRSPQGAVVGQRRDAVAIVREPTSGRRLDLPAATRKLDNLVSTRSTFTADLPVQTTGSPITHDLAQAAVDQAQTLLGQPILFSAGTKIKGFELRPDQLIKLLTFTNRYDQQARQWQVAVGIDDRKLRDTLAPIAALVEFPPLPAYFKVEQVDGTDYAVPNQGANGVAVDINGTAPLILAAAATHAVTVKVIYPHAAFDVRAARKLQLDTEQSVAQVPFSGASNERATNLSTAARALDNVRLDPGQTFSVTGALGPVTGPNHYALGLNTIAGTDISGVNGGTNQVASALFQAGFRAGLAIPSRTAYPYLSTLNGRIGYDAMVVARKDGPDLRITNNTKHTMLILVEVAKREGQLTTYIFNNQGINRKVQLGETQVTINQDGSVDAIINRQVSGDVSTQDQIVSHYQAVDPYP